MTDTTLHLSRVPVSSLGVDEGGDRNALHKAIMRAFPADLPGDAAERRLTSQILFRIEEHRGENVAIISSVNPPSQELHGLITKRFTPGVEAGQDVRIKLAVNPVRRLSVTDATGKRKVSTRAVPSDQFSEWLNERLSAAFTDIQIVSYEREITAADRTGQTGAQRGGDRHRHAIVIDTIEAIATVTDADAARELMISGVGRSKAFGCGLLSIAA